LRDGPTGSSNAVENHRFVSIQGTILTRSASYDPLQAVDSLSPGQLVGLAVAMDHTGSHHDGLMRAILDRADLTGFLSVTRGRDDTASGAAGRGGMIFTVSELLSLARALASVQVTSITVICVCSQYRYVFIYTRHACSI